jgi:hypothetical protein
MSRRLIRSCLFIAPAILLLLAPLSRLRADPDSDYGRTSTEYQVKAAFLFKFAKFVEWPAHKFIEPDSPLIIGVVGADPFGGQLEEAVQDQRFNDRTVLICHVQTMEELRKCHILFVCRSESSRIAPILSEVRWDNVLTVGDSEKFSSHGGIINFVMVDNTVRFQINNAAARRAGLKISSKLLQLSVPQAR